MNKLLMVAALVFAVSAQADRGGATLFMKSATVNNDGTVSLPLYEGRSNGRTVWYIVTEASRSDAADSYGVAKVNKLENARGTAAIQRVTVDADGVVDFPATVDFAPERIVIGDAVTGFPPQAAEPGAIGEPGYTPLIELPDGTILNAPQVANDSGLHDRVEHIGFDRHVVHMRLAHGFSRGNPVLYISTDSSSPVAAALEESIYAPALDEAPFAGGDGTDSARASLAAFINGPTGVGNPERQGLNSALLGEGAPLNVLAWTPNQGRYSPLWDVHLAAWVPGETPTRQRSFADVLDLAEDGKVTAPDGSAFAASGFIVNCPVVSQVSDR